MNHSEDITELESEFDRVLGMVEQDEDATSRSDRPAVERIFLSTSRKLRSDLQIRLRIAKAERAMKLSD